MIDFYQLPFSHFSAKVRIVLLEKNLDVHCPPMRVKDLKSEAYLAINPLGKVPFLIDGDVKLGESEVIVEYLNEQYPHPPLMPSTPAKRAKGRYLSRLHDLYLAPQLSVLFRGLMAGKQNDPSKLTEIDKLHDIIDMIEKEIQPEPYFLGEQFNLCDAAYVLSYYYILFLTEQYGHHINPQTQMPKLSGWFDHVKQRHSAQIILNDAQTALAQFANK